ncbi:putative RNA helicase [Helianthus annuus]|nr:putative RNA helicase [Helianthus annuus]KAJ0531711.1 putative RNA helicase [Helianthus annuus]KAJ0701908.1 putative RNA helicase [Helianthus annuus]
MCSYLNIIDLHDNLLTRPIPPQLGGLVRLTVFDVSNNKLFGPVSESLGNRTRNLRRFNEGKDVVARAKTGSGKTFAYLLPLLQKLILLDSNSSSVSLAKKALAPTAIILVPSRELCQQSQLKVVQLTGEPSFSEMASALAGPPDVFVSTPACVQRCLSSGVLQAKGIQESLSILVLDEWAVV